MPRPNQTRTVQNEVDLARRIAYERENRGWSYAELAKRMTDLGCSINASAIYKVEKGEPPRRVTVDELVALKRVFDLETVDDLLAPVEVVEQQQAYRLLAALDDVADKMGEGIVAELNLWVDYFRLAVDAPELREYVDNRWEASINGRESTPVPLVEGGDPELDRAVASASGDFQRALVSAAADFVSRQSKPSVKRRRS